MVRRLLVAVALTVLAPAAAAAQVAMPLPAFEAELLNAPVVAIARAAADVQRADAAIARRAGGLRVQAGAQTGGYHEQVSNTLTRDYAGLSGQVGLREPILGEAAANHDAVLRAQVAVAARDGDVEVARRTVRRAVRQAYIGYWNATRRAALADDFTGGEDELRRALALRTQAHLLLRADELDVFSQYAAARRNGTRSAREAIRARGTLGVALGRVVPPFAATTPAFVVVCPNAETAYLAALARSPALTALRAEAEMERRLAANPTLPVTAGVAVMQSLDLQRPAAGTGRSTSIDLDLSFPVGAAASRADLQRRGRARADAAELRIAQARAQLRVDVNDAWAGIAQTTSDLRFEQARADAGREAVREAELRYGRVPGDALEQLARARYVYYGEAADRLDAQAALLVAQTELAFLTGDRCDRRGGDAAVRSAPAAAATALTVYAWDAAPLLDAASPDEAWSHLADEGIVRVLLGFDARRIAVAATPPGTASVNDAIATAAGHGIEVDLLLGDSHWIDAADRGQLLAIIRSLHGIAFGGLELDLEPAQLVAQGERHDDAVRALAQTVGAAAAVSPWPVGISVSFRELSGSPCLACLLRGVKLREIALLTFVANPERAADLVRPILRANPAVRFAVAESVEPGLAVDESYARRGRMRFDEATARLDAELSSAGNFAGVRVQALADLERLAP